MAGGLAPLPPNKLCSQPPGRMVVHLGPGLLASNLANSPDATCTGAVSVSMLHTLPHNAWASDKFTTLTIRGGLT